MSGPSLRAQRATEWVIVSTGMFTSFLFEPDFDVVNLSNRTLHALGSWDTQVTVTSPADIGRPTTAIYLHQPRIVNEVVFVAGETTSYRQVGGYRGARNAADVQQSRPHPARPAGAAADRPG